jgi:sarcosine oxidase
VNRSDVIVVGAGGMGTAAAVHLAARGARVTLLERFAPGHDRGSSHGQTRLIRLAYHEHPAYVPLLRRAYELWRDLEREAGRTLLVETGLLLAGHPGGTVVPGALAAAAEHGLTVERLSAADVAARYPAVNVPDGWQAVLEPRGGYLFVEECVLAHAAAARRRGADVRSGVAVHGWRVDGAGVAVETDAGTFSADRLVLCPGPWAAGLIRLPDVRLTVLRKPLFWYEPPAADRAVHASPALPCFGFDRPEGFFYGFPRLDGRGLKIAEHTGGRPIADALGIDRAIDADERRRVEACLAAHLPRAGRDGTASAVCLYTMSPDEHFVIGLHPAHPQVALAAGFSGHGFKFASLVGEVLADLALDGRTAHPIGFLRPERFAGG